MTFFGLTQDFLRVLREKGCSAKTLAIREGWLRRLRKFCERHRVRRPEDLEATHLAGFQGELAALPGFDGNLAPNTLYQALTTVRSFLRWAHQEGYLLVDPSRNLAIARPPAPFRPLLTQEQVRRLLESPRRDTPLGLRDSALLEILYGISDACQERDCGGRNHASLAYSCSRLGSSESLFSLSGKTRINPPSTNLETVFEAFSASERQTRSPRSGGLISCSDCGGWVSRSSRARAGSIAGKPGWRGAKRAGVRSCHRIAA